MTLLIWIAAIFILIFWLKKYMRTIETPNKEPEEETIADIARKGIDKDFYDN